MSEIGRIAWEVKEKGVLGRRESHLSYSGMKLVLVASDLKRFLWRGVVLEVTLEELLALAMIWMGAVVI